MQSRNHERLAGFDAAGDALTKAAVRAKQTVYLAERIFVLAPIEADFLPPILLGDLNADPLCDEIRYLKGQHIIDGRSVYLADVWEYAENQGPGYTYARDNAYALKNGEPNRRIDYIFVRGPDKHMRGEPSNVRRVFVSRAVTTPEAAISTMAQQGVAACDSTANPSSSGAIENRV